MLKLAVASDIHGMWGVRDPRNPRWTTEVNYPKADFLLLAGDILGNYSTCRGDYGELAQQLNELERLNAFYADLKRQGRYKEVFFVAGNHDWVFEKSNQSARDRLTDVVYLQDEATIVGTPSGGLVKIYGTPWQPWFYDWAFNFPNPGKNYARARAHARNTWDMIPTDTDILITHGPPKGIRDLTYDGMSVGCPFLTERIQQLSQLKLHVFGHIHHSRGVEVRKTTAFANAALCTEGYNPDNRVQVINISV